MSSFSCGPHGGRAQLTVTSHANSTVYTPSPVNYLPRTQTHVEYTCAHKVSKFYTLLKWIIVWLYIWDYLLFDIVSPFWVYVLLLITFKWTLIICFRTPPLHKCNSADCRLLSGNSCKQFILWFVYWKGLQGATRDQICLLIIYVYLCCKISLVYPWTVPANANCKPATSSNHIWAVPIAYLLQRVWKWPGQCPYLALHNRHRQSTLQGGKRPVRYPLHVTFLSYSLLRPQGAHTRRGGVPRSELV